MTNRSKKATLVFVSALATCVLTALVFKIINDRHRARARQIQIGDSMERVRSLLGSLTATHSDFFSGNPFWSYGSRFDFDSGFPWLRFRLFGPGTNDLAFYFDASRNVVRIQIPNR